MDQTMIAGHVVDAASQAPVVGARVTLIRIVETAHATFGEEPRYALTDASGQFAFQRLTPGRYRVDVEKSGFAPSFDPVDSKVFELEAGQSITQLRIALAKGAVISGGIRDAAGEPLPEMTVWAMRLTPARQIGLDMIQGGVGDTNDLGEFRIANLPAGEYLVIAAHQPRMRFGIGVPGGAAVAPCPTYYPGTTERQVAQVISLRGGETVGSLWFSMVSVAAFTVSGFVVDEAGTPLGGAMVSLMRTTGLGIPFVDLMVHTDLDGTFHIGGVIPGRYRISAIAPMDASAGGLFSVHDEFTVTSIDGGEPVVTFEGPSSRTKTVTVENGDVTGVTVVVTPA